VLITIRLCSLTLFVDESSGDAMPHRAWRKAR